MQKTLLHKKTSGSMRKMALKNINEASQKTHRLAIDLFLLMILTYNVFAALTAPTYEIIPTEATMNITIEGKTTTTTLYTPQTTYELITEQEYNEQANNKKAFMNKITLIGTSIFILYAITQWNRWKQKLTKLSSNTKNKKPIHKTRNQ
jgi:hypothetical protein